ncbi:MAG: type I-G CRISPR-associated protein Csb2 [Acidimicrobiales bacterium]
MSTVLGFRFPLGRYHATPWGHQVNEGMVEWPPSSWRILRALYATWRSRLPQVREEDVLAILGALTDAPSYLLPRHAVAHTRHYMPDPAGGRDKTFDPFSAVTPEDELLVQWPSVLDEGRRTVLSMLCDQLSYLGRAESVCDARIVPEDAEVPCEGWVEPGGRESLVEAPVKVLVPRQPLQEQSLLSTTARVRRDGHVVPPGARLVPYVLPQMPRTRVLRSRPVDEPAQADAVVLHLRAKVLPGVRDTVLYASMLRKAAMSRHVVPSETLSGRLAIADDARSSHIPTEMSRRRSDDHAHAHYFLMDTDGDRLLDTAVVWAPEKGRGLTTSELMAILSIDVLAARRSTGLLPVRVAAAGMGRVADVLADEFCSAGRSWTSETPFVPYRHRKKNEPIDEFVSKEVNRELMVRGLPPATVEIVGSKSRWLGYRLERSGRRSGRHAFGVHLEFQELLPVPRPLALGYLSHYGLGLFRRDR